MSWVLANLPLLAERLLAHLGQSIPPIVLAFVLAIPIAKLANARGWLRGGLTAGAGLLYAVPSLPLFIVLPIILGTGIRSTVNIIVALTIYGLALMVPSASEALRAVSRDTLQSATAQGYAPLARFLRVELPLAGPALVAGLRVVAVSTVSLVTVGGVLGVPSLGMLFIDGFQRSITAEILAGIVLTAALAIALDLLIMLGGRLALPWSRVRGEGVR
ncbi:ABC transporter permease subunit [Brachybacterium halotolerans subsp. kimchii]|uniref:ABC transporter permease subunit n=1 Tax=Brachybacterium halotolerans TaxID=2795215 RepID=A0ABS1BCP0_9MICO|nr:ABC transporter permease subunit [Brachybacterium halotolerans]MBK0332416.1 ABC transporter permease subunit [Brachybacterium halotolerans]MCG7310077.1 ABC transporter permease subunit [Brachybacterium sp. ACRRE]UEJ84460.1 ABC transporter permease subunit [Brachybacterium halotolerans subsp. kimchii]